MNTISAERKKQILFFFLFAMTAVRIALFTRAPFYLLGDSAYDDYYQVNTAASILKGEWLGEYSFITLTKGISYPLFLAAANVLGISYPVLLGLFYAFSSFLFCRVLAKQEPRMEVLALFYLFLLFNPAGFIHHITYRLYRNSLSYPSVILVTACVLGSYYTRHNSWKKQLPWLIGTGLSFSFFQYLREDSVWLLPLIICSLILNGVSVWMKEPKRRPVTRIAALILPLIIIFTTKTIQQAVNQNLYGMWIVNDRSEGNFAKLTGNMMKLQPEGERDPKSWIQRDVYANVVDHCPSLKQNADVYLGRYDSWASLVEEIRGQELVNASGDLAVWGFREALEQLGYYENAAKADQFCGQVNEELLEAVREGDLAFDNAIHLTTLSPGFDLSELPGLAGKTVRNIGTLISYENGYARIECSTGDPAHVEEMKQLSGVNMIRGNDYEVRGWTVVKGDLKDCRIQLESENGTMLRDLEPQKREDVELTFPEYKDTSFGYTAAVEDEDDIQELYIGVYDGEKLIGRTAIVEGQNEQDDVILCIEQAEVTKDNGFSWYIPNRFLSSVFIWAGRIGSLILFPLSAAVLLFQLFRYFQKQTWDRFDPVIISLGILFTVFLGVFGTTLFTDQWLPGAQTILYYSSGQLALVNGFELLGFHNFLNLIRKRPHSA